MEQSLEALQSGKLKGAKSLKLACGLTKFPEEIIDLADTLEFLDLSDNDLTTLPNSIAELKKLKILFFARNQFTEFPVILKNCPALTMIGFKSNQLTAVPENAFPPKLQWLVLTDNNITAIPKSIGSCNLLEKFLIAGNQLTELPDELANCQNLGLLRIADNNLDTLPDWLFKLPKISWVAFGGNPVFKRTETTNNLKSFSWEDFTINELIGEGASGLISKATWNTKNQDIALKIFKGNVTSDGLPEDEMAVSIAAGAHKNLIPVLGKIKNHPENKSGLILELISPDYINLGNPPSLDTCTRDVFDKDTVFSSTAFLSIAKSMASVAKQLHSKGINHGDFYAHNILINKSATSLLGDFGAASFYDVNSPLAHNIQRVEVGAFGCLLEDVLALVPKDQLATDLESKWQSIIFNCKNPIVASRMSFEEILVELEEL
ncbi:leucine-rich repeat-containing serine/threonine-protein kinase [Flavobacteriaceae bacterium]|nr:leucine-rich repeat-containing serine/threonine-protein kinase [Flavobacteriaceae bacterium]